MLILAPILFFGWKLFKRTKLVKSHEADLVWERPIIDAYEETFVDAPVYVTQLIVSAFEHLLITYQGLLARDDPACWHWPKAGR